MVLITWGGYANHRIGFELLATVEPLNWLRFAGTGVRGGPFRNRVDQRLSLPRQLGSNCRIALIRLDPRPSLLKGCGLEL
jgi:hypothetical protein